MQYYPGHNIGLAFRCIGLGAYMVLYVTDAVLVGRHYKVLSTIYEQAFEYPPQGTIGRPPIGRLDLGVVHSTSTRSINYYE